MKKNIFIICILGSMPVTAQVMQPRIKSILDTVFHYAKISYLHAERVNWNKLEEEAMQKAAGAGNVKDLKPVFEYMLNSMNDPHGSFIRPSDYSRIATFTNWDDYSKNSEDKRPRSDAALKIINDREWRFSYALIGKNTGYLRITGIAPNADKQKEAANIRNAIRELHGKGVDNWIVDLRYNGGGNMNPMMAGIAPLLGNGFVGYLSNMNNDTLAKWTIRGENFFWDDYMDIQMEKTVLPVAEAKVAVLVSRYTISSGEFLATTFKGRRNTRFFGEATGGLTTSTNWVVIGDELIMSLSTGVYCDRNGIMYEKNIPADEPVEFEIGKSAERDIAILAAIEWLHKN